MKKRLLTPLLIIFLISLVLTQQTPPTIGNVNPETGLPEEAEKIKEIGEAVSKGESKDYIKKEWETVLAHSETFGPLINRYQIIAPVANPLSRYTVGMEPSLSWLYMLTLVLWITLAIALFRVTELFALLSRITHLSISIGLTIGISLMGITPFIAEAVINTIALTEIWGVQLILIVAVIIGLVLINLFSKSIKHYFKNVKEKQAKTQEKLDRETLGRAADISRRIIRG